MESVQRSSQPSPRTLLRLQQAEQLLHKERWREALSLLKKLTPPKNDFSLSADVFYHRGEADRLGSQFSSALDSYRKSHVLYQKIDHSTGRLSTLSGIAACLRHLEDFTASIQHYRRLENWARTEKHNRLRADALCGLGLALKGKGELLQAQECLQSALPLYTKLKDPQGINYAKWSLGVLYRTMGQLAQARSVLSEVLLDYEQKDDRGGWAYAGCALGGTLRVMGRAQESFELYRKSWMVFKKIGDPYGIAYGLCGMASADRVLGFVEKAKPRYEEAAKMYLNLNQKTPYAFTVWGQAGLERTAGRYKAAIDRYERARKIFRNVKDARGEIYADLGIGYCFLALDQVDQAREHLKATFTRAETLGLPLEACHAQLGLLRSLKEPASGLLNCLSDRYRSLAGDPDTLIHRYKDIP